MEDEDKTKEQLINKLVELRQRIAELEASETERKWTEEALKESEEKYRKIIETANDAIFIADVETGIILDVNKGAEELLGMPAEKIVGIHQTQLHPKEEAERYSKIFLDHIQSGKAISGDLFVCHRDGHKIPVEISTGITELMGKKVIQGIFRDITERKRAEEALRRSERELAIRNQIADIFLTVPDEKMYGEVLQVILKVMESRYGVFGYIDENRDLVVPSMTRDVWDQCQVPDKDILFPRETWGNALWCRTLREKKTFYSNRPSRVPKGHIPIRRHINVSIIYQGEAIGLLAVADKATDYDQKDIQSLESIADHIAPILNARLQRDRQEGARKQAEKALRETHDELERRVEERTTELAKANEELRESERRFRDIAENALEWIWEVDTNGKYTYASPVVEKILGYKPKEVLKKYFYDLFHPEDREELKKAAFEVLAKKQSFREFINRNVHKNGKTVWLLTSGVPILDEKGNVLGYRGADTDITERKRIEETLRESEKKYRSIWETSKDVLYLTSKEGKFIDINQAGVDLFGYSKKDLLKIDLARHLYVNPDDRKIFQEMIEKDGFVKDYEVEFKKKDKTKIYVSITANVRKDKRGEVLGYEGIIRDVTERKEREEKIRHLLRKTRALAERDPLTGLFNHRRINELLHNEIERAKRKTDIFSIMMLDVNDLKLINDTHGHVVGDKLLKNVATTLKSSSRSVDSIGRYGGDEFLMILPYTDGEKAKALAERISKRMREKGLKIGEERNIPIRLSIGVATYPFDNVIARELISLADRCMYESKRSGKDAVSATMPEVSEFLAAKTPSFRILRGLVAAVDSKDYYTRAHSDMVTNHALSLAKEMGLSDDEIEALKIAGLLHDIGKIGVPDAILRKPGSLKKEEYDIIKQHPELGAMMLGSTTPHREDVMGTIMYHHERYDGKGYPGKLKGEDIPLLARITAIADAYSAMVTDRPYRKALTKDEAIEELKKGAGTQFDPDLVSRFIGCLKEIES